MRRRSPARRLVSVASAVVVSVLLGGCALSLQSLPKVTTSNGPTYPVRAVFANVLNLPVEAQVRLGAQVIGQVSSISTSNFQADLTLQIDKTVHLYSGTTAQVRFDNPLGDEYVILSEPVVTTSSGQVFLQPGALIPEGETSTAPSVEETFGALSLVLNGGGLNQLETIIHELNDTFNGNQPQIRSFLVTIDHGVATVTGGRADIDAALASLRKLTVKLDSNRGVIAKGISTIAPAVGILASENGQLSLLIRELSDLGAVGTRIATESGQNSVTDVRDLLPVINQLESVSNQLGPDLSTLAAFEAETPKIAPGDYLQVKALVNVLLPAGGFEPTPLAEPSSQGTQSSPAVTGRSAISDLLQAGLI